MTARYTPDFAMSDDDPALSRTYFVAHGEDEDGGNRYVSGPVQHVFVRRNDLIKWCLSLPKRARPYHDVTIVRAGLPPELTDAWGIVGDMDSAG